MVFQAQTLAHTLQAATLSAQPTALPTFLDYVKEGRLTDKEL
jgi:hypothetical protein